ncbi:reverse transcriptase domain-containing protein, partial [Tanacetum coccineum]
TPFIFSKECIEAFETLKMKLTQAPILVAPDWDLPFEIMCDASDFAVGAVQVFPYGTVELSQNSGPNFKVNGHRLKHYFGGDVPTEDFPDCEDSHARSIHMSFTSSASFWESSIQI